MCDCQNKVNESLAESGHRLAIGFLPSKEGTFLAARLLIETTSLPGFTGKRQRAPLVSARYCPFCGQEDGLTKGPEVAHG